MPLGRGSGRGPVFFWLIVHEGVLNRSRGADLHARISVHQKETSRLRLLAKHVGPN